jgi:glycosyltransferase involved in cell wall biosynthesis
MAGSPDPLRVLHIGSLYPPYAFGGAERVVELLAEEQVRQGLEVAVASLTRDAQPESVRHGVVTKPQANSNPLWIEDAANHPSPMRMMNKIRTVFNLRAAADFGRAIDQFRPDVVHTHSMVELPPMIWAQARRRGVAVVHTLHDYDLLCIRGALFKDGRPCERRHKSCVAVSAWKQRFHGDIDAVVAISSSVLETHRRYGLFEGLAAEAASVIWNPTELREQAAERASRLGPIVFGFMGRLVPEKGLDVILEACRLLPPTGWSLNIAGKAPGGMEDWIAKAQDLPVTFLGYQDAASFLSQTDVLLAPSVWAEPFGLVVVEAYSAGVPVIGARSGGITELVGMTGGDWLVPPGEAVALAARMRRVLDEGRASLPSRASFRPVLDAVAPERVARSYSAVYQAALAAKVAATPSPKALKAS